MVYQLHHTLKLYWLKTSKCPWSLYFFSIFLNLLNSTAHTYLSDRFNAWVIFQRVEGLFRKTEISDWKNKRSKVIKKGLWVHQRNSIDQSQTGSWRSSFYFISKVRRLHRRFIGLSSGTASSLHQWLSHASSWLYSPCKSQSPRSTFRNKARTSTALTPWCISRNRSIVSDCGIGGSNDSKSCRILPDTESYSLPSSEMCNDLVPWARSSKQSKSSATTRSLASCDKSSLSFKSMRWGVEGIFPRTSQIWKGTLSPVTANFLLTNRLSFVGIFQISTWRGKAFPF